MKIVVKNIIGIYLIIALLPATSGVIIFHHICNTSHKHTISIFSVAKCDHLEETTGTCEHCHMNLPTCSLDENTHCFEYTEFLSIEADFVLTEKQLIKANQLILSEKEFYEIQLLCNNHYNECNKNYIKKDTKKPVEKIISFITFYSQSKSSEDTSEFKLA